MNFLWQRYILRERSVGILMTRVYDKGKFSENRLGYVLFGLTMRVPNCVLVINPCL